MKIYKKIMLILIAMLTVSTYVAIPSAQATPGLFPRPDQAWVNTESNGDVTDVATGDLSGDGVADVAFIDSTIPDTVFVVYGTNGTVYWKNTSVNGTSIAVGDVDGDGKNEVVAGGENNGNAGITVFEDDGTFKFFYPTNSNVVKDIELGDIDNDGVADIVTCNGVGPSGQVYAFKGTDGSNIAGWPRSFPEPIVDLAIGNLDGSGGKDVAALSNSAPGTLYVNSSAGDQLWRNDTVRGRSVEIGNVDSDPDEEVVIGDRANRYVYVYDGDSGVLKYSFNTVNLPSEVELGDLDGNSNDLEIAAITEAPTTIYAIDINASDQVNEMWHYNIGWQTNYYGEGLAIGDVDRDYKNEVIAASGLPDKVYAFDGIDSNADGIGDVVWVSEDVVVALNNIGNTINDIETGDINGDGDMDVIAGTKGGDSVYTFSTKENTVAVSGNTIYFDSDPANITEVASAQMPRTSPPGSYSFPYGIFSINITVPVAGQSAIITITLPDNLTENAVFWKYSPNGNGSPTGHPGWYKIPMGDNDGDNVITITLQDGGIGDSDGVANGEIIDQGGPAIPVQRVPALTQIGIIVLAGLLSFIAVRRIR